MRHLSRCLLAVLAALLLWLLPSWSGPGAASDLPSLPELPLATDGPTLVIQPSARVELLQVATALTQQGAISLNTPVRTAAFREVGRLASHPAITALRDLQAQGLGPDEWLALLLAHGEPPRLSPRRPVDRWLPSWGESLSDRERQKALSRAAEELGDFWDAAELGAFFKSQGDEYSRIQEALAGALPRGEPMADLDRRLGVGGEAVLIIPSPLATRSALLTLPVTETTFQTRVAVLALPDGQLPAGEVMQGALRYEAVAAARLQELFQRFEGELAQASRALNEARRVLHTSGISLTLSGGDIIGARELERSLLRALFLRFVADDAEWVDRASRESVRAQLPGVEAMAAELARLDADPARYPDLYTALPLLLNAAVADAASQAMPSPPPADFDQWEGGVPLGWSITAPTVPAGVLRPTQVERVSLAPPRRGGDPGAGDGALRMIATAETNQWREALSDPIVVHPGDRIHLTGRIRTQEVVRGDGQVVGAHLFLVLRGPGGAQVSRVAGRSYVGTQGWVESSVEQEVPAGALTLQLGATLGMTGTADFDRFEVRIERPPASWFLEHGGFEVNTGQGPLGWERWLILQNSVDGPSNESAVRVDPGRFVQGRSSLQLEGGRQTSRWFGVRSAPITSKPGRRLVLTAYTRAEGVRHEGVQSRHANLMLEFLNERGVVVGRESTEVIDGTTEWRPVRIEATAPLDTVWVRVNCMLTLSGAVWFDDVHLYQR